MGAKVRKLTVLLTATLFIASGGLLPGAGTPGAPTTTTGDPEPRVDENTWHGRMSCLIMTGGGYSTCPSLDDGEHSMRHEFNVEQGLKTLVVRMTWEPSEWGSEKLKIDLKRTVEQSRLAPGVTISYTHTYADEQGASPIEFRLDAGETGDENDFENIDDHWELRFSVRPTAQYGIVKNQSFQVDYNLYYHEHAPESDPSPPPTSDAPPTRGYIGTLGSGVTCLDPPIVGDQGSDLGGVCRIGVPDPGLPTRITVHDDTFGDDIRFSWRCIGPDSSGPSGRAKGSIVVNPTASGECTEISVTIYAPATNGTVSLETMDTPDPGPPPRIDEYRWDGHIECLHRTLIASGQCTITGTDGLLTGEPQQTTHHNRLTRNVVAISGTFEWEANDMTEGPLQIQLGHSWPYPFQFEGESPVAFHLDADDLEEIWAEEPDREELTLQFQVWSGSTDVTKAMDQPFTVDYNFHAAPDTTET